MTKKKSGAYKISEINDVFNSKDRLITPFKVNFTMNSRIIENDPDSMFNKVRGFLNNYDFDIPSLKDYIEGTAYKKGDKNTYKIGRILTKYESDQPIHTYMTDREENKEAPLYSFLFKTDMVRHFKGQDDLLMVISRHPYDIWGMSTGRMWTSCMDMKYPGNAYKFIPHEIDKGTLIAYLIPKDEMMTKEKVKLKKPLSRILLKPMRNDDQELAYSVSKPYGGNLPQFTEALHEWVNKNFNSKVKNKEGFSMDCDVYPDPYEFRGAEEVDNRKKEERYMLNELENARREALSKIPLKDRNNIEIHNFIDEGDAFTPGDMMTTIIVNIFDADLLKKLNITKPVVIHERDKPDLYYTLAKKYPLLTRTPDPQYFKYSISVNPRHSLIKYRLSCQSSSHWLGIELMRFFLMRVYPYF